MLIPQKFQGTEEQKTANFKTHNWTFEDGRCFECDSKMWHKAAEYPCGEEPQMIEVNDEDHKAEHPILSQFYSALGVKNETNN